MQIKCPICSTAIDVPEGAAGQKGRCVTCSTKFLIPTEPGGHSEILERGEAPAPPPVRAAPKTRAIEETTPVTQPVMVKKAAAAPALNVPAGGAGSPSANAALARAKIKKKGSLVPWIILLLLCAGGGYAYFKYFGGPKEDTTDIANNDKPAETSKPEETQPTPPPQEREDPIDENTILFEVEDDDGDPSSPPPPLDAEMNLRALSFMQSEDPDKRNKAYNAFRELGGRYKSVYGVALTEARTHHLTTLLDMAKSMSDAENAGTSPSAAHGAWKQATESTLKLVATNWKATAGDNIKAKHADMDAAFTDAETKFGQLPKMDDDTGAENMVALEKRAEILAEIGEELAWCSDDGAETKTSARALLAEAGASEAMLEFLSSGGAASSDHESAAAHNQACGWANPNHKKFAEILNKRRAVLGLPALRLDEKLSTACAEHSSDMLFLDFSSHTGSDGSNAIARAKRTGFTGTPTGECIYRGGPSADDAHKAWWYSDTHRRYMYSEGSDTLGIGTAGPIWTINTAKQ